MTRSMERHNTVAAAAEMNQQDADYFEYANNGEGPDVVRELTTDQLAQRLEKMSKAQG